MHSAFCTQVGSNLVFIQYLQNRCVLSVMDQIILKRAAITDFPGAKYLHVTGVNSNQNQQSVFCFGFCWGFFRFFFLSSSLAVGEAVVRDSSVV